MVHVKKCPLSIGRGRPTTEFFKGDKAQIYCMGRMNSCFDEPLEECAKCADWAYGEQCEKDFEEGFIKVKLCSQRS